jgi:hypothetical protein
LFRDPLHGFNWFNEGQVGVIADIESMEGFFMNYRKNYDDYIVYVKSLGRRKLNRSDPGYVYYERHHIIPKCMGGEDVSDNVALLTAREHMLAHYLLMKIFPGYWRLAYSFGCFSCHFNMQRSLFLSKASTKMFQLAAEAKSSAQHNSHISIETRQKLSEAGKKRLHTDEEKEKIGRAHKGKVVSFITRCKLSNVALGRKRGPMSEVQKQKLSLSNKGIKKPSLSDAHKALIALRLSKSVMCVETGHVYSSTREADFFIGRSSGSVSNAARTGCCCGGFHWSYLV